MAPLKYAGTFFTSKAWERKAARCPRISELFWLGSLKGLVDPRGPPEDLKLEIVKTPLAEYYVLKPG